MTNDIVKVTLPLHLVTEITTCWQKLVFQILQLLSPTIKKNNTL